MSDPIATDIFVERTLKHIYDGIVKSGVVSERNKDGYGLSCINVQINMNIDGQSVSIEVPIKVK